MIILLRKILIIFLSLLPVLLITSCSQRLKADPGYADSHYLLNDEGDLQEVLLDGSRSQGAKTYEWTQISGPNVNIIDNKSVVARFTPEYGDEYVFKLKVCNSKACDESEKIVSIIHQPSLFSVLNSHYVAVTKPKASFDIRAGRSTKEVTLVNRATGIKYSEDEFDNIALLPGDNIIDIESVDGVGTITKLRGLAVYNKDIKFMSSPALGDHKTYEAKDHTTIVAIAIKDYPGMKENGVTLVQTDENFKPIPGAIATLRDDGNLDTGDDIKEDGIYSGKVNFKRLKPGIYYYRVAVNYGPIAYSAPVELESIIPVDVEEYAKNGDEIIAVWNKYFPSNLSFREHKKIFDDNKKIIIEEMQSLPSVYKVWQTGPTMLGIVFKSGMSTDIIIAESYGANETLTPNTKKTDPVSNQNRYKSPDTISDPVSPDATDPRRATEGQKHLNKERLRQPTIIPYKNTSLKDKNLNNYSAKLYAQPDYEEVVIGSLNAIGFAPFADDFNKYDGVIYGGYKLI